MKFKDLTLLIFLKFKKFVSMGTCIGCNTYTPINNNYHESIIVMGKLLAEHSCVFALNLLYLSGMAIVKPLNTQ